MTELPKSLSEWWSKKGTQERAKGKVLNLTRAPRKVEGQADRVRFRVWRSTIGGLIGVALLYAPHGFASPIFSIKLRCQHCGDVGCFDLRQLRPAPVKLLFLRSPGGKMRLRREGSLDCS
jgi:hypothetical protein